MAKLFYSATVKAQTSLYLVLYIRVHVCGVYVYIHVYVRVFLISMDLKEFSAAVKTDNLQTPESSYGFDDFLL